MLRKILFFLFSFSLLLFTSLPFPKPALAASCDPIIAKSVNLDGGPATNKDSRISFEINSQLTIQDSEVLVFVKYEGQPEYRAMKNKDSNWARVPVSDGLMTIGSLTSVGNGGYYLETDTQRIKNYEKGRYDVVVMPKDWGGLVDVNKALCKTSFNIADGDTDPGSDNYCEVKYLTEKNDYTIPNTKVKIAVKFASGANNTGDNDTHRVTLKYRYGDGTAGEWDVTTPKLTAEEGWEIPQDGTALTNATYNIIVREFATHLAWPLDDLGKRCSPEWPFLIETEANGGGHECSVNSVGCDYRNVVPNAPLSQPCDEKDFDEVKGCTKIKTALGTVGTGATEFVRWVLGFVLGISGGIVLIIIIITGYRLMTSQGDPEKVKNAREQLTAAIVGLLFIIFSLVILQFITADILQLPGFGQ